MPLLSSETKLCFSVEAERKTFQPIVERHNVDRSIMLLNVSRYKLTKFSKKNGVCLGQIRTQTLLKTINNTLSVLAVNGYRSISRNHTEVESPEISGT